MKRLPLRDILWLFLATRLFFILMTYIAYVLLTAAKYSNTPVDVGALLGSWNRWDAANYVRIAQYGYQRVDLAFFPLFPFLIAIISHVLGSWSYLPVGTLISNGAFLGMLCVIYYLAADIAGDEVARRSLLYLCIFPTAFFFFAAYNESLYLFFAAGTFLALYKQRWWLAGSLGLLAALTRSAGALLVIPYLYQLWLQREELVVQKRWWLFSIGPIIFIPLGTLIYALYCWMTIGNPLEFITVQQHSGRHLNWPWVGIWQAISALVLFHPQAFGSANQAHLLLDLSATLGFLLIIVLGWRRLPKSYSIWMSVLMVFFLIEPASEKPDILLSNQRFVLELFPAFMTLAMLGKHYPRLHYLILLLFPPLLAVLSIAFIINRWVV
jgi:hypothetical protein